VFQKLNYQVNKTSAGNKHSWYLYCKFSDNLITLRKSSGMVIGMQDLVVPTTYTTFKEDLVPIGCSYRDNHLVLASFYSEDSMDILCYDINTMAQQWAQRMAKGSVDRWSTCSKRQVHYFSGK
jgi:hypothetical protein